jgi:hypothetical protein
MGLTRRFGRGWTVTPALGVAVVLVATASGESGGGPRSTVSDRAGLASAGAALPSAVYAPYFETWATGAITTAARRSGARYFALAFLGTLGRSSCTLAWNGERTHRLDSRRYLADIASVRALGGDVFPSFGGQGLDQSGREIADSCKNVATIANAYESVITTYDVTRLDMDVEERSLQRRDGIDRRNKAIKLVEAWASGQGRTLEISYTLPTSRTGLDPAGFAVLRNAKANGTRVDGVNIMAFDYFDGITTDMGAAAIGSARGLFKQLKALYPTKTSAQLWGMVGITMMPGIDDDARKTEVTRLVHVKRVYAFAMSVGIGTLSIWAIQRDNGGCPGRAGWNTCSGIAQSRSAFSHVLSPFTGSGER